MYPTLPQRVHVSFPILSIHLHKNLVREIRLQILRLGDSCLALWPLTCGAPQRSILPLIFMLFMLFDCYSLRRAKAFFQYLHQMTDTRILGGGGGEGIMTVKLIQDLQDLPSACHIFSKHFSLHYRASITSSSFCNRKCGAREGEGAWEGAGAREGTWEREGAGEGANSCCSQRPLSSSRWVFGTTSGPSLVPVDHCEKGQILISCGVLFWLQPHGRNSQLVLYKQMKLESYTNFCWLYTWFMAF